MPESFSMLHAAIPSMTGLAFSMCRPGLLQLSATLFSWSAADHLAAHPQAAHDACHAQWLAQMRRRAGCLIALKVLTLELTGCWLFSYAILRIDASRRGTEGADFEPTGNFLPPVMRSSNPLTLLLFVLGFFCEAISAGCIVGGEAEVARHRLRLLRTHRCGRDCSSSAAAASAPAAALLIPSCLGPCGLDATDPLRRGVCRRLRGAGLIVTRVKDGAERPPAQWTELRAFAKSHDVEWCTVSCPRVSAIHCSLLRRASSTTECGVCPFELRDLSVGSCVHVNGVPCTTCTGAQGRSQPGGGRTALRWGDRISVVVCARPFAEIAWTILPDSDAWISRAQMVASGGGGGRAVDELRRQASEADTLSAAVKRAVHAVGTAASVNYSIAASLLCMLAMLVAMGVGLALLTQRLDCSSSQYIGALSEAISRHYQSRNTRGRLSRSARQALNCMLQPEGILYFWLLVYTLGFLGLIILGQCVIACSRRSGAQRERTLALEALGLLEASPTVDADSCDQEAASLLAASQVDAQLSLLSEGACEMSASTASTGSGAGGGGQSIQVFPVPFTLPSQIGEDELVCPISLERMSQPVTVLPCGHVFERHQLLKYFASA